jgi:hypothetical protein
MSEVEKHAEENFKAFQRELPNLTARRGKYLLMRHGEIVNFYDTLQDAYSTGAAVFDDNMFSVCLLKGPKRTARRKTAKKKAEGKKGKNGKAGKAVRPERAAMTLETMSVRAGFADTTPRRENIPGIAADLPDIGDWREAAGSDSLRIRPFFTGSGSRPFSCLRATQIRIEPPRKKNGVAFPVVNDFYLAQECR